MHANAQLGLLGTIRERRRGARRGELPDTANSPGLFRRCDYRGGLHGPAGVYRRFVQADATSYTTLLW